MRKNRQTAKYHIKNYIIAGSLAGAISMASFFYYVLTKSNIKRFREYIYFAVGIKKRLLLHSQ